jgi:xanthosine utilization system XapX-like protein
MESNPYAPPQVTILSAPLSEIEEAEAIRKEHIKVEATVKSVGTLYYLGAFLLIMFGLMTAFVPSMDKSTSQGEALIISVLVLAFGIAEGVLAYGLRRLRSWARWPTVALAFIGLLGFPLGTLISIVILVNLLGRKATMVFSPEYKAIIAATPHVKHRTSLFVKIVLVLLLLVLISIIAALSFGRLN